MFTFYAKFTSLSGHLKLHIISFSPSDLVELTSVSQLRTQNSIYYCQEARMNITESFSEQLQQICFGLRCS